MATFFEGRFSQFTVSLMVSSQGRPRRAAATPVAAAATTRSGRPRPAITHSQKSTWCEFR